MGDFCHVNDAFLMAVVKKLDGNLEMCLSPKSISLLSKFGSFYIQFDKFSYLRIRCFEKAPFKLPQYPEDLMIFL